MILIIGIHIGAISIIYASGPLGVNIVKRLCALCYMKKALLILTLEFVHFSHSWLTYENSSVNNADGNQVNNVWLKLKLLFLHCKPLGILHQSAKSTDCPHKIHFITAASSYKILEYCR